MSEQVQQQSVYGEDFNKFVLILGGHIFFQTLCGALDLDLFTLLAREGGLTREEIARRLHIEEKPARILLLGCVALGLITLHAQTYRNSEVAERFLSADSPLSMIPIVRWQQHINYPAMARFTDALKRNQNVGLDVFQGSEHTLYERLAHTPHLEAIFQNAMAAISVQANANFAKHVNLSQVRYLVDVGGGNATNIITLAHRNPELRAAVFDSASVCEHAKLNIAKVGLTERLGVHVGDCFSDPFPTGADAFLFSHFFTIWSEEKDRLLLKKTFEALPKQGRVFIFNMMQWDSESGPLTAAMGSPYFLTLATGEGMLYTWSEYEAWMKAAGFTDIQRQMLPMDHGVICGTKL